MPTYIRVKDLPNSASSLNADDYIMLSGSIAGARKIVKNDFLSTVADEFKAAPSTYKLATLDASNKVDSSQWPASAFSYQGTWAASTNTPTLANGTGTAGYTYYASDAGSVNFGAGAISFTAGDAVVYDGSIWQKVPDVANILDGAATAEQGRTTLDVNSTAQDAESNGTKLLGPSVYFDGSNDFIQVADDSRFTFSDGVDDLPFSVSAFVNMTDASTFCVAGKYGTTVAVREWLLQIASDDKLRLTVIDTSGNACRIDYNTALTAYEGQWIHVAASYSGAGPSAASGNAFSVAGNGMSLFVNGVDVTASGTVTNQASYSGMSDTSQAVWLGRLSNSYSKGHIRNVQIFNRELTAAEVADLARGNELGFADQWAGSLGAVYTSDFSAGVDGWIGAGATVAGNIDSIGPGGDLRNDNLRSTISATAGTHRARLLNQTTSGKRYRVTFDYYIPSSNTFTDGFGFHDGNVFTDSAQTRTLDAWARFTDEFVADGDDISLYWSDSTDGSYTGSGTDVCYIRNVKVTEIGTLADFRSERFDSSTGKWYDLANGFVGTNSGATLVGREVPVTETGTWTPSITFGSGSTGIAYSYQEGVYTRTGDVVHASCIFQLSDKGSDTGDAVITGLPFLAKSASSDIFVAAFGRCANLSGLTSGIEGAILNGTSTIRLNDVGATGSSNLNNTHFTNTSILRFSATYQIQ